MEDVVQVLDFETEEEAGELEGRSTETEVEVEITIHEVLDMNIDKEEVAD